MATQTLINWQELSNNINVQTLLVEILAGGFRYLLNRDGDGNMDDHTVQRLSITAAQTTLTLPLTEIPEGKIGDFAVYVENNYESDSTPAAAELVLDGWGTDFGVAVFDGDSVADYLTLAAGEKCVISFTLTPLTQEFEVEVDGATVTKTVPVWFVLKRAITIESPTATTEP